MYPLLLLVRNNLIFLLYLYFVCINIVLFGINVINNVETTNPNRRKIFERCNISAICYFYSRKLLKFFGRIVERIAVTF